MIAQNNFTDSVAECLTKRQQEIYNRNLIMGCGGLGSTVIANLASLGIGHIGLVDNDRLELLNLNRQYIHNLSSMGKLKTDSAKNWIEKINKMFVYDGLIMRFKTVNLKKNPDCIVRTSAFNEKTCNINE